jgi:hypothetical protein
LEILRGGGGRQCECERGERDLAFLHYDLPYVFWVKPRRGQQHADLFFFREVVRVDAIHVELRHFCYTKAVRNH